jgi:putative copper export protein
MLVVTGVTSLWLGVARWRDLPGSTYGTLFFAKLGCVAAIMAVGAYHARRGALRARRSGPRAVGPSLTGEVCVAVLTIAVTAVLTGSARPGE